MKLHRASAHAYRRIVAGVLSLVLVGGAHWGAAAQPALSTENPGASTLSQQPPAPTQIYANAFALWIYATPRKTKMPIGYVRAGQAVTVRQSSASSFDGCKGGWYAVEPAGFVCLDQTGSWGATRYSQAMRDLMPAAGPYPFEYGVSLGTPAFRRAPVSEDNNAVEQLRPIDVGDVVLSELLTDSSLTAKPVPWFLQAGGSVARANEVRSVRRLVPAQTLLSLVSRFEWDKRQYYQVADGTIVPLERVKLLRRSIFEGVWLRPEQTLPLAWPREAVATRELTDECAAKLASEFPASPTGQLSVAINVHPKCVVSGETRLPVRVPVALTGRRMLVSGSLLLETRSGDWVDDTSVRTALLEAPKHAAASGEKWIHFSIQRGTLVAYEGNTPVFATLASPGSGELNARGARRLTPKGTFRINFKHLTDDMSSEDGEHRSEWKADVPFAMYFSQPYGIHVSYWHEAFGEPKSGGCINVSPIDGARLFDWTEPALPAGWYGVGSTQELGLGTVVYVTD